MEPRLLLAAPPNPSTYAQASIRIIGVLTGVAAPGGAWNLIIDGSEYTIPSPSYYKHSEGFQVEFDFDFSKFIPKSFSKRKFHHIALKYQDQEITLCSPESHMMLMEKLSWEAPLGGYNYPESSPLKISSNHIVIEGWALKKGCVQKEVVLWMDRRRFPCTNINIWSPLILQRFPSFKNASNAHFSVVISRSELPLSIWPKRKFYAEILFNDGSKLRLPKIRLDWRKAPPPPSIKKRGPGIVFISNNLRATEGAPRVLFDIIKISVSLGEKVIVIAPVGGELEEKLRKIGVTVHICPELYLCHVSRENLFRTQIRHATELIRDANPGIVFGNTIEAFWGISFAQSIGIKTMWLIHESINPKDSFLELDPRVRLSFLKALDLAEMIFVSNSTKELYWEPYRKISVIPNGVIPLRIQPEAMSDLKIRTRKELEIQDDCLVILSIGTICQRKGQDMLVSALSKIEGINFKAILVGGRPSDYLDKLKSEIHKLGLEDRVLIKDETSDVGRFYASADLFVISSRQESAPLVSLEALNWGLPIVSTDAYGLLEQLEGSGAALLSDVDDVVAFRDNITKMLTDTDLRLQCGRRGKLWVEEKFNLEKSILKYRSLLECNHHTDIQVEN